MRRKKSAKLDRRHQAFTRFMIIVAVMVIWMLGVSARLVHLQVTQSGWLREKALDIRQDIKQTKLMRGSILDRNGRTLAMSVRARTLYADATEVEDVGGTAAAVAKALKIDVKQLSDALRKGKEGGKKFVPLAKKLDDEVVTRVNRELDRAEARKPDLPSFKGLHWREDQRRSYPYQTLASQTIGFSDSSDSGKAGIEQSLDKVLRSSIVEKVQVRDRLGRVIREEDVEKEGHPGDVVLTIDANFQYFAEQALERGVVDSGARSGMLIAIKPKTGEVLALANYPNFDPNTVTEANSKFVLNNSVQSVYSPGSVFKLVTYASAVDKGLLSADSSIDAGNGTVTVGGRTFKDKHGGGPIPAVDAMAKSSNVCAIKTALSVGKEDFHSMTRKMGFGSKTGIELPGEVSGIIRSPERWSGDSLASQAIGYEMGVTALQMAVSFATIGNNGVRVSPNIVKEVRTTNTEPPSKKAPEQVRVVSAETAAAMRELLKKVVISGTGKRAKLDGYSVAGKTGTAWKFNPETKSVDSSKYISSFIGMAPADDPEVVVAVVIDEPRNGGRDGGQVAAPIFRDVTQYLLEQLGVREDQPKSAVPPQPVTKTEPAPEKKVPAVSSSVDKGEKTKKAEPKKSLEKPKEVQAPKSKDKPGDGRPRVVEKLTAYDGAVPFHFRKIPYLREIET
ncbi:MAG: penicillin-binding protein 2 [Acidobacteriota bacterium]|nr:MAG: penicillin-binding protein 2 [Acidobacteriota bacterium]